MSVVMENLNSIDSASAPDIYTINQLPEAKENPMALVIPRVAHTVCNSAAVLTYLRSLSHRHNQHPIPNWHAYDSLDENELDMPYLLLEAGTLLAAREGWRTDFCARMKLARELARAVIFQESVVFPIAGRLRAAWSLPESHVVGKASNLASSVLLAGFGGGGGEGSLREVIIGVLRRHGVTDALKRVAAEIDALGMLQEERGCFNEAGERRAMVLWHGDLNAGNLAVGEEWTIGAMLEWEETMALPPVLARRPPVWLWAADAGDDDWDGDYDSLQGEPAMSSDDRKVAGI